MILGMHILSAEQFGTQEIEGIMLHADELREQIENRQGRRELATRHLGYGLCNLFYEPSTRTRMSFAFALKKLGLHDVET